MKINLGDLRLTSPAFEHGGRMPDDQSILGAGTSPALAWDGVPDGTEQFVIIAHDHDAPLVGGFSHWVLYGIPGHVRALPEGGGAEYTHGFNDLGAPAYQAAGPPAGHGDHCYYFHLYALDADPGLGPALRAPDVLARIEPNVLQQARLVGTFSID